MFRSKSISDGSLVANESENDQCCDFGFAGSRFEKLAETSRTWKLFGRFADGVTELNACISSSMTRSEPERRQLIWSLI